MDSANHWNRIYASAPVENLGWYEDVPEPSLRLLERCKLSAGDAILDAGAGASAFVDCLIEKGFQNLLAVDISAVALDRLKARLGKEKAGRVQWIQEDITQPVRLAQIRDIAFWHDRALLHFLTEEGQRQAYKRVLTSAVRPGGYAAIAAFSPRGAKQCSGLEVQQYDPEGLAEFLGKGFELRDWFDYLYTQPSGGLRPYTYTLFQRHTAGN